MSRTLLPIAALLLATTAAAAPDPASLVSYRKASMSALGRHMKALGMIVKGEVERPADVVGHAAALHAGAADLTSLFPAGTGPESHKTEARPEIWTKWSDFQAAAATFEKETAALEAAARAGDAAAVKAAFEKVGAACGGCHEPFKSDK